MPYWFWIVLALCLLFGFFGGPALHVGYVGGWSPLGVLVVIVVLYLIFRPPRTPVV